jgi:dUTP pyrophosphatase
MPFEIVEDKHRKFEDKDIKLPIRATRESAGYDIYSNEKYIIEPGQKHIFWTDVKIKLPHGLFLMIVPRSSSGIKYDITLGNTIGIVDGDYYGNPDNDGNIAVCLKNNKDEPFRVDIGDRIAQGIILCFGRMEDEPVSEEERKGGIGSTGQ